jgi:hypothetical protein
LDLGPVGGNRKQFKRPTHAPPHPGLPVNAQYRVTLRFQPERLGLGLRVNCVVNRDLEYVLSTYEAIDKDVPICDSRALEREVPETPCGLNSRNFAFSTLGGHLLIWVNRVVSPTSAIADLLPKRLRRELHDVPQSFGLSSGLKRLLVTTRTAKR